MASLRGTKRGASIRKLLRAPAYSLAATELPAVDSSSEGQIVSAEEPSSDGGPRAVPPDGFLPMIDCLLEAFLAPAREADDRLATSAREGQDDTSEASFPIVKAGAIAF